MEFFYKLEQKLLGELEKAVLHGDPVHEKNIKRSIEKLNEQMKSLDI